MAKAEGGKSIVSRLFKRYFLDAMGAMALGLFASLIIGLIISQIAKIPGLSFLGEVTEVLSASSPVVGASIGAAIAWGLSANPLVIFSCVAAGAVGYAAGGPVGAYVSGVVGAELGQLVSKKTPIDIVVTPFVTIVAGGLVGVLVGPTIQSGMVWLGSVINAATELTPIPMGAAVSVIVGMVLTLPISSAALCIMLNLEGIAAGAATVGCCAQMIGFAVASYRDNGVEGLLSQGLGTSMLQVPNILRKPQIWIAPTLAAAILGPISTYVLGMKNVAAGAGMGTSGLVGQITTIAAMSGETSMPVLILEMAIMHFIAPAALTLCFDAILRKIGWVKSGDMKLPKL